MILSTFEVLVWLSVPFLVGVILMFFIVRLLKVLPVIGDYLDNDGRHNIEMVGTLFAPVRMALLASTILFPGFVSFAYFDSSIEVKSINNINGKLHIDNEYAFPTTAFFGGAKLALDNELIKRPYGIIGSMGEEDFNKRIKGAKRHNLKLFINKSGVPVYTSMSKHFRAFFLNQTDEPGSLRDCSWGLLPVNNHQSYKGKTIKADRFLFELMTYDNFKGCL